MITKKEAIEICERGLSDAVKIRHQIQNSDKENIPSVEFFKDEKQFQQSSANLIHLGMYGPIEYLNVENAEEYTAAVYYFYGHENQHYRSTADEPYAWGIKRGFQVFIEYIAEQVEGKKKKFKSDKEYIYYLERVLPNEGVFVSAQMLIQISADLINMLEDGRIERIACEQFPGFKKKCQFFRGKLWKKGRRYPEYEEIVKNPFIKFNVITSEILALATTQIHSKGFVMAYAETELIKEIQQFYPYIANGVAANKTRNMALNHVEICRHLAPCVAKLCTKTRSEMEKMMQELLNLAQKMAKNMPGEKQTGENGLSEKDEIGGSETPSSLFGHSNLEITLDDETYDKVTENMEPGEKGNLLIKREHPKEQKSLEDKKAAEKESKNQNSEQRNNGKSQNSRKSKDNNSNDENENSQKREADESGALNGEEKHEGKKETIEDQNDSKSGFEKKTDDGSCDQNKAGEKNNKQKKGGSGLSGKDEYNEEEILRVMDEAAKETRAEAESLISSINEQASHNNEFSDAKVKLDKEPPLSPKAIKDICENFKELKRQYALKSELPAVLKSRGKALRKKNERYFRSLSKPTVTNLDSGCVDPSLIYSLSFGNTEIFRKKGNDKVFDGCAYVLIDNSGSMCGTKRMEACKAGAVIEEGFKGLFPFKIVAFDEWGSVVHEVIKNWEEVEKKNCCWNFCLHGRTGGENDDASDIRIATRELLSRPERKKLLLVLSDGAPASVSETKKAIEEARKKGINLIGIYFEEGPVGAYSKEFERMYQKDYICCELKELDKNLNKIFYKFSRS